MVTLDFDSLRSFVAVAETASFSKAADRVGRSQSAVSLQLARLERTVGKTLVLRRQGRVQGLTEHGRTLLPYARRIVALNDAAYQAVTEPAPVTRLRLGVPFDAMDQTLFDLLHDFKQAHQGSDVELISDVSEKLHEMVEETTLDVAVFKQCPGQGKGELVARQVLIWMGAEKMTPLPPDSPVPLVIFPHGCAYRAQTLLALEEARLTWHLAYVGTSVEAIRLAVACGVGVSALPQHFLANGLVPLQGLPEPDMVEVVVRQARGCSALARELATSVTGHLGERWAASCP